MRRPSEMYLITSATHFYPQTLSSSEAALLLNSTKNRDLWESPVFGACAENSFRIHSQSDCQTWLWTCIFFGRVLKGVALGTRMLIFFQKVPPNSILLRLQACCVCACACNLVPKARFLFNKLTSVFHAFVLLFNGKFRYNIVKVDAGPQTALIMLWPNSLSIRRQTHEKLMSICR